MCEEGRDFVWRGAGIEVPTQVPGCIADALCAAKAVPPPRQGLNALAGEWAAAREWTLCGRAALPVGKERAFLRARGFRVEVVPFAICGETPVSSTRIRAAVASGDLDLAAAMLGRPWALEGEVFAGKGVGHTLGFPTLNVRPATGLVRPPRGVYAVETAWGRGAANYGLAPTMGARAWAEPVLEVHLLEVPAADLPPLRGRTVAVEMRRFLRPERRFASVAELQAQIARDLAAARA